MAILEVLYKTKSDISIKELAERLEVSKQTIVTTLEFLETLLPSTFSLCVTEKQVSLQNKINQPVDVAIIEIAKKTTSFQILEYAYLNKGLNIGELAERLFISETALRDRIKHINKVLKLFDCRLSSYEMKFIGDEAGIRYFVYHYFGEFQDFYYSICDEQLKYCASIYMGMKRLLAKEDYKLINHSYQQVTRWLTVTSDRLKAKQFIEISEDFIQRISKRSSYGVFRRVYKKQISEHLNGLQIPESEVVWAYIIGFKAVIYSNDDGKDLYRKGNDNLLCEQEADIVSTRMFKILNIAEENRERFLRVYKAYFINTSLLTEISPVLQMSSPTEIDYVANSLKNIYDKWFDYLSINSKGTAFPIKHFDSIATQLAMISSQFAHKQRRQETKILYSFEGGPGFETYMEALARRLLPKEIKGVFVHSRPITSELIRQIQPDILVHNYDFLEKVRGCKMLRMSEIPQEKEWEWLKELAINLE